MLSENFFSPEFKLQPEGIEIAFWGFWNGKYKNSHQIFMDAFDVVSGFELEKVLELGLPVVCSLPSRVALVDERPEFFVRLDLLILRNHGRNCNKSIRQIDILFYDLLFFELGARIVIAAFLAILARLASLMPAKANELFL